MASRYGAEAIEFGLYSKIVSTFDRTGIPGITEDPLVLVELPNPGDIEPYIYINCFDSEEVHITKSGSSRMYMMHVQVVCRSQHNASAEQQRDQIMDQIAQIIDTDTDNYIDIDNEGFNVYIQNITDMGGYTSEERGATYWIGNITCEITASAVVLSTANDPVQAPEFTYAGFEVTPTSATIEAGDAGTITVTDMYASDNMGWDWVSTQVVQPFGADGSLSSNVYTIGAADENIQLGVNINYEFITDTSSTTQLSTTHRWTRRRSLRFGSIAADGGARPTFTADTADTYGVDLLSNWTGDNQSVMIGTIDPDDADITIEGQQGEYIYIMYDADEGNLASIRQDLFDADITSRFEAPITVGNYVYYISSDPLTYTGDIAVTLRK